MDENTIMGRKFNENGVHYKFTYSIFNLPVDISKDDLIKLHDQKYFIQVKQDISVKLFVDTVEKAKEVKLVLDKLNLKYTEEILNTPQNVKDVISKVNKPKIKEVLRRAEQILNVDAATTFEELKAATAALAETQ